MDFVLVFIFYFFGLFADSLLVKTNLNCLFFFLSPYLIYFFFISLFYFSFPLFLTFLVEIYIFFSLFS